MAGRIDAWKDVRGIDCTRDRKKDKKREEKKREKVPIKTKKAESVTWQPFPAIWQGKNLHTYFVPPVYDLLQPQGFFKIEEEQISAINIRINELENSRPYLDAKERWKKETEQAKSGVESKPKQS